MNEDRTFGIEIECHSSINDHRMAERLRQFFSDNALSHDVVVSGYYGHDTDASNTTTWKIKPDGSVHALNSEMSRRFPNNMEIVSPVLKGTEGMKAVRVVCKALDDLIGNQIATASRTCGFHVHHHVGNEPESALVNVANSWLNDEKFFYFALPNSRLDNSYCRKWASYHPPKCRENPIYWYSNHIGNRKTSLNFKSYLVRGTFEWRLHSGTVEWPKISTWILMTQRWLDLALSGGIQWNENKTFDDFIDGIKQTSIQTDHAVSNENVRTPHRTRVRIPRSELPREDDESWDNLFVMASNSRVRRMTFQEKFINAAAKKQRVPNARNKTGAIIKTLLSGWVTKDQIVSVLDDNFGTLAPGKQLKFVSGQLTNLKNLKWGYGFNIQKRGKKFKLFPLNASIDEINRDDDEPQAVVEQSGGEISTITMPDLTDEQVEALNFFIGRTQLFEGRRNPENLGAFAFNESAEEQQEHDTTNAPDPDVF